jgi:chromosome segregation ATPase
VLEGHGIDIADLQSRMTDLEKEVADATEQIDHNKDKIDHNESRGVSNKYAVDSLDTRVGTLDLRVTRLCNDLEAENLALQERVAALESERDEREAALLRKMQAMIAASVPPLPSPLPPSARLGGKLPFQTAYSENTDPNMGR